VCVCVEFYLIGRASSGDGADGGRRYRPPLKKEKVPTDDSGRLSPLPMPTGANCYTFTHAATALLAATFDYFQSRKDLRWTITGSFFNQISSNFIAIDSP